VLRLQRSVTSTWFAESGGVTESGGGDSSEFISNNMASGSDAPATTHLFVSHAIISNYKSLLLLNYEGSSVSSRIFLNLFSRFNCVVANIS